MVRTRTRVNIGLWHLVTVCLLLTAATCFAAAAQSEQSSEAGTSAWNQSTEGRLLPQDVKMDVVPTYEFDRADHVANGVALRNRTSGTISLRGVPLGSDVLLALLYWNFSDGNPIGSRQQPVLFDGNLILGQKTADSADPGWNMAGNHSYVADVTRFVGHLGHPNQDYVVVLVFDDSTSTTGQNPWAPFEVQTVRAEGATLVVIYRNSASSGELFVYDTLSGSEFYGSGVFYLHHTNVSGPAKLTMAGADGQLRVPGELTFFDGQQIAGCPVTNSDWDGSDGWPLPQLWDTHTHAVSVSVNPSAVEYQASGDNVVPVVFILDMN